MDADIHTPTAADPADPPRLALSIGAAARAVGISRSYLYAEMAAGRGPVVTRLGSRSLVRVAALEDWLAEREAATRDLPPRPSPKRWSKSRDEGGATVAAEREAATPKAADSAEPTP